jgi:hypothetical protein
MRAAVQDIPDLELALLRRGVDQRAAGRDRCHRCKRTPLMGERIYVYETGRIACELCRTREREAPLSSKLVHGPGIEHPMRVADRRAA